MEKTDALERFLKAEKPEWCIPTDVAVAACLLADDAGYPGHVLMAARCAIHDIKAVMRSLKRMEAAGWVIRDGRNYILQTKKLPK